MITEILSNALMGAISGYVTNSYAVESMFGSHALSEGYASAIKTSLADSIGTLIEAEAVRPEKIEEALVRPDMKIKFENLAKTLKDISIPRNTISITSNDIPSYDKLTEKTAALLLSLMDNSTDTISAILRNAGIDSLLPSSQVAKIADSILDAIYGIISDSSSWDTIYEKLTEKMSSVRLSDIVPKELTIRFNDNITEILNYCRETLSTNYMDETDRMLEAITSDIDAEESFKAVYDSILRQPLSSVIPIDTASLTTCVNSAVTKFLASEKCHSLISGAYDDTVSYIKSMGLTLCDLLPQGSEERLHSQLSQKWPQLGAQTIMKWLQDIRPSIEEAIINSAETVITEKSVKDRDKLSKAITRLLDDQLNDSSDLMKFLITMANDTGDRNIVDMIINEMFIYLKSITVKGMIEELENEGTINRASVIAFILDIMGRETSKAANDIIESLKMTTISSFIPEDAYNAFYSKAKYLLYDYIKETIILSPDDQKSTSKSAGKIIDSFVAMPLNELASALFPKDTAEHVRQLIFSLLKENNSLAKDCIISMLNASSLKPVVEKACSRNSKQVLQYIKTLYKDSLFPPYEAGSIPILTEIIKNASAHAGFSEVLGNVMRDITCSNMGIITDGIIKKSIAANIEDMGGNEFLNFTLNLTEQNRKRSIYSGSALGLAAGALLPAALEAAGLALHPVFQCCAIGYVTDLVCIKTLFMPCGNLLPGEKQAGSSFASIMAKTVTPSLLNEEIARVSVENSRSIIKNKVLEYTPGKYMGNIAEALRPHLAEVLYECGLSAVSKTNYLRSDRLLRDIAGFPVQKLLTKDGTESTASYAAGFISQYICSAIKLQLSTLPAYEDSVRLTEKVLTLINTAVRDDYNNKVQKLCRYENLAAYLGNFKEIYLKQLEEHMSQLTMFSGIYNNLEELVHNSLFSYVSKDQFVSFAASKIHTAISSLCSPDTNMRSIMAPRNMLRLNTEAYKYLSDLVSKIDAYIYDNRLEISDSIFETLYEYPEMKKTNLTVEDTDILLMHILINSMDNLIKSNTDKFFTLSRGMMESFFYDRTLAEMGAYPDIPSTRAVVGRFMDGGDIPIIKNKIYFFVNSFLTKINNVPVSKSAKFLGFDTMSKLTSLCRPYVSAMLTSLADKLKKEENTVISRTAMLFNYGLPEQKSEFASHTLLKCFDKDMIELICSNISTQERKKKLVHTAVSVLLDSWTKQMDYTDGIYKLTDFSMLADSITQLINKWEDSPEFNNMIQRFTSSLANEILDNNLLPAKTKVYLNELFADSYIDALSTSIYSILNGIDFESIIRESIRTVDSRKINKAFGHAINKNIFSMSLRGISGGIFGINAGLSGTLAAAYTFWHNRKSIDGKLSDI